jgi:hypothetical protein
MRLLIAVGLTTLIIMGASALAQEPKPQHVWMNELAQQVDPSNSYHVAWVVSLSCINSEQPEDKNIISLVNGVEYAHAEFDIDILTGQLKPIGEPTLPKPGFRCPHDAPKKEKK